MEYFKLPVGVRVVVDGVSLWHIILVEHAAYDAGNALVVVLLNFPYYHILFQTNKTLFLTDDFHVFVVADMLASHCLEVRRFELTVDEISTNLLHHLCQSNER